MSKKYAFELNRAGVRELLRSDEMESVLIQYAQEVSRNAGEGYNVWKGSNRSNVSVRAVTAKAEQDNLENNTLLKAVGKSWSKK